MVSSSSLVWATISSLGASFEDHLLRKESMRWLSILVVSTVNVSGITVTREVYSSENSGGLPTRKVPSKDLPSGDFRIIFE